MLKLQLRGEVKD